MDAQSKYRAAMAAVLQAKREIALKRTGEFHGDRRKAGHPVAAVSKVLGISAKQVKNNGLHREQSALAWIASYKLAGREDDGA